MIQRLIRLGAVGCLAAGMASMPLSAQTQTNEQPTAPKKPAAEKKESGEKKQRFLPFKGKLTAIDKNAKTITVGERTFQITSETRIFKAGKPALLEEGIVGEAVTGSYKKADDGKLTAYSVHFGGRTEGKNAEKKEEKKAAQ